MPVLRCLLKPNCYTSYWSYKHFRSLILNTFLAFKVKKLLGYVSPSSVASRPFTKREASHERERCRRANYHDHKKDHTHCLEDYEAGTRTTSQGERSSPETRSHGPLEELLRAQRKSIQHCDRDSKSSRTLIQLNIINCGTEVSKQQHR